MSIPFQPPGYHTATPYLFIKGAADAITYYQRVFGAKERMRIPGPDGKVMHAEIEIGDSVIMLADEFPEMNVRGPLSIGGSPVSIMLYLEKVDDIVAAAIAAGGKIERPVADQFYGDRTGSFTDPFGHRWTVSTHVEDVSDEEIQRRMAKMKPEDCTQGQPAT